MRGLADLVESGQPLSAALRESGRVPICARSLIEVGEQTGGTEETLSALV